MSDNILYLYLGVVYDWGDNQISICVEKSFQTEFDVSTRTGLRQKDRKEGKTEEVFSISYLVLQWITCL